MGEVFGYPAFDARGEMILTTYDNDYAAMLMDVRVYRMEGGKTLSFCRSGEEIAVLLLSGCVTFRVAGTVQKASRKDVFTEGPWCVHAPSGTEIRVDAETDTEILVQCTKNDKVFAPHLYRPEDAPWAYSSVGKFGNVAKRRVNTIFDYDICPESNMVLGEILNDPGNWSGYIPHRHPQPELYFFKFDKPQGFGASFVGGRVFKSVDNSFSAIPGGEYHPQAAAPGYQMYTCWMIRHLDGNPWVRADCHEDEHHTWLYDAAVEN